MKRSAPLRRSDGFARLTVPVFRPKTCKACRERFTPRRQMQAACGPLCAATMARASREKAEAAKKKAERKADREKRTALKTRGDWTREAQQAFNRYVRLRDAHLPCVSCGRHHDGKYDAGHYRTTGAAPELRFDEANCHKQCVPCNRHLHGNLIAYRAGLIARLGAAEVERIEGPHEPRKYTVDDLKAIRDDYRRLVKQKGLA